MADDDALQTAVDKVMAAAVWAHWSRLRPAYSHYRGARGVLPTEDAGFARTDWVRGDVALSANARRALAQLARPSTGSETGAETDGEVLATRSAALRAVHHELTHLAVHTSDREGEAAAYSFDLGNRALEEGATELYTFRDGEEFEQHLAFELGHRGSPPAHAVPMLYPEFTAGVETLIGMAGRSEAQRRELLVAVNRVGPSAKAGVIAGAYVREHGLERSLPPAVADQTRADLAGAITREFSKIDSSLAPGVDGATQLARDTHLLLDRHAAEVAEHHQRFRSVHTELAGALAGFAQSANRMAVARPRDLADAYAELADQHGLAGRALQELAVDRLRSRRAWEDAALRTYLDVADIVKGAPTPDVRFFHQEVLKTQVTAAYERYGGARIAFDHATAEADRVAHRQAWWSGAGRQVASGGRSLEKVAGDARAADTFAERSRIAQFVGDTEVDTQPDEASTSARDVALDGVPGLQGQTRTSGPGPEQRQRPVIPRQRTRSLADQRSVSPNPSDVRGLLGRGEG